MTNDQANAANVLEKTLELVKQILLKHETLVISEMRRVVEAKNHELKMIYAERDRLHAQLPDGMQKCTIVFKECEKGHGWLTATNWVQHECHTCERDKAIFEMEDLRKICAEQMERANTWRDRAKTMEDKRGYMSFWGPKSEVAEPGCGGDWTDEGWQCGCGALYPRYCKGT